MLLRPPATQVRGWVVSALGKLAAQAGRPLTPDAAALVEAASRAESVELQQRALEVSALLRAPAATQRAALPYDAAAEDVGVDPDLPFLDGFVHQVRGAAGCSSVVEAAAEESTGRWQWSRGGLRMKVAQRRWLGDTTAAQHVFSLAHLLPPAPTSLCKTARHHT